MDMAPPRSLPELNDDLTAEILLRVAPDEPAGLFRASVVCKLWHRILSDPYFLRRYQSFHRRALLLGFFYNLDFTGIDLPAPLSRFVATTAAASLLLPHAAAAAAHDDGRRVLQAFDCRHGRVLFEKAGRTGFAVWDPISDDWTDLPPPGIQYTSYAAAVLCAVAGCDHRDCCGGPFLVVCIGRGAHAIAHACVYSSEDCAWQPPVSDGKWCSSIDVKRPVLIGDGIYCIVGPGHSILRYDLVKRCFSRISKPCAYKREPMLMENEDGSLGFVGIRGSTLYLWSKKMTKNPLKGGKGNPRQCEEWSINKLKTILCVDGKPCMKADVIGFAEGVGVLFISTNAGVFKLELKSRRMMKVSNPSKNYPSVVPFISFFTPDRATGKLQLTVQTN